MDDIGEAEGRPLLDRDGGRVGRIDTVYVDPDTQAPEWALVSTGALGGRRTMVPLRVARALPAGIQVPFPRMLIRTAPRGADEDELPVELERRLLAHYGLPVSPPPADGAGGAGDGPFPPGEIAPVELPAGEELILNGERLVVGSTLRPSEHVRFIKRVVTESVVERVLLRREVLRVEREPIDASEPPVADALKEEVVDVLLRREEPVVEKRVVPVERIRIGRADLEEEAIIRERIVRETADPPAAPAGPPPGT